METLTRTDPPSRADPPSGCADSPRPLFERLGASAAELSSLRPSHSLLRRGLHFGLAAVIAASVALAAAAAWTSMPDFDWHLRLPWLLAAVAGFTVLHLWHAALWRRLLRSLGHDLDPRRSRSIWCTSVLARYTPGSVLMPMVRVAMAEREGVPKRVCLASVVYEIALTSTGAAAVGSYAVFGLPALDGHPARFMILAAPLAGLAMLHPAVFRPLADRALGRLGRERLQRALPFSRILVLVVLYAASFVLGGVSVYALLQGVHPIVADGVLAVLAAQAAGYVFSVLAFVLPAGLGAREAGVAAVLSIAVPVGVAVAVAVATRLVQLTIELVAAGTTPVIARRRARHRQERT